jgi:hypothetical protein
VTALHFVVLVLAVFRISRLVIEDTITDPIRSAVLSRWPGKDVEYEPGDKVTGGTVPLDGKLYAQEPTWLGDRIAKLISCYWCFAAYPALLLVVTYALWPTQTVWFALPWAVAAGASVIGILMHEAVE